jgi:hypothetical protein
MKVGVNRGTSVNFKWLASEYVPKHFERNLNKLELNSEVGQLCRIKKKYLKNSQQFCPTSNGHLFSSRKNILGNNVG